MESPRVAGGQPRRRHVPVLEDLEGRRLLSAATSSNMSYRISQVRHEYDVYVSNLQQLEFKSKATPAEELALRDDARAISQDAASTTLSLQAAQTKALAVSLQLDHAPLNGWVGDVGWSVIADRLTTNLDGLNVPASLTAQTVTDMEAIARSAGVSAVEAQHLDSDAERLTDGEQSLGSNSYVQFPDPQLYYTQHLRGFFRGGAAAKLEAQATLDADLGRIQSGASDNAAEAAVLHRDARLLEIIGATLTSQADAQFGNTFVAAFALGAPSPQTLAQLPGALRATLGAGASPATLAKVDQLASDAGTLFVAAGSSAENIRTVVNDVQALVAVGGAAPLDPFKVVVIRAAPAPSATV
ncbi:MAG: hypothetical protein P4L84_03860 [Isosphaeraceae bacterium]|nr:hypothetical protein [Isosphaeraceae bacterium]